MIHARGHRLAQNSDCSLRVFRRTKDPGPADCIAP